MFIMGDMPNTWDGVLIMVVAIELSWSSLFLWLLSCSVSRLILVTKSVLSGFMDRFSL